MGCMVSKSGIQANPEKIEAIRNMKPPRTKKDIQKLSSRIAALGRFISKSAERSLPFFKLLSAKKNFSWGKRSSKPSMSSKAT